MPTRRELLSISLLTVAGAASGCAPAIGRPGGASPLPPLLDDIQRRSFRWFWDTANPANGLIPDRWPTPSFASIAAVGFALTAYPVGVERGHVGRAEARDRVLATLKFFWEAPQGPQASGVTGHKGFFYHFLDMTTGHRFETVELSTIDTALFLGGALFCASYFDRSDPGETEIRRLAGAIHGRVDWTWAQARRPFVALGWSPEDGFLAYDWKGYSEAMLLYILALASPTHPVGAEAWAGWTGTYGDFWTGDGPQRHLGFPPMFGHQYSHVWIDFRGIRDAPMRAAGLDYFENSRRATLAQRAYAIANPMGWKGYGADIWGLTACDGPIDAVLPYRGEQRTFRTYSARGVGAHGFDDGTIAPTAAIGSIAFAPAESIAAATAMHARYGKHIYGDYGFLDSFNPSFDYDAPVHHGRVVPGVGWVDRDYLGIDQGPIVTMIENHRSDLIWRVMRGNPTIRTGLTRAGFTGGWLERGG